MKLKTSIFYTVALSLLLSVSSSFAQGTAFTYQGRLNSSNSPANGSYDFTFALFNASSGGVQTGGTITDLAVPVTNGLFTVTNDFGAVFNGTAFWLQIGVRTNGGGSYQPLSPRQQLTPTPYAITAENVNGSVSGNALSGIYSNALTLSNLANSVSGNGSGLTSLNASALTTGTVPDARLSANVAMLNSNQTFLKTNVFSSGGGAGRLIVSNGFIGVDTNIFSGLSLQYDSTLGEAALMSSFNLVGGEGYLSFYTKAPNLPVTKQMQLDFFGVLSLDQGNSNNGALNNNSFSGAGLTFGNGGGEGIASKRTAGGNQFGLDFYTSFSNRMVIASNGFVGIGRTNSINGNDIFTVRSPSTNGFGGMNVETAGTNGWPFYGYAQNGNIPAYSFIYPPLSNTWVLDNQNFLLSFTGDGKLGVNTLNPGARLDIGGTAGTDGIRFPDATVQTTAPRYSFSSNLGLDPGTTNNFIGPTTSITITATNQRVLVIANKALGSTTGATGLTLYIGYRISGGVGAVTNFGGGSFGQSVPANTRVPMGLSAVITGLAPGTYDVGLSGSSGDAIHWNNNEWGYVSALIF